MKSFKQFNEEMPANNASGGEVAGLGKEPPVSKLTQMGIQAKNSSMGATAGRKVTAPVGAEGY